MNLNNNYPREFYDALFLERNREVQTRIDLLDWKERKVGEIQGKVVEGSLTLDGSSSVRRTCSLTMVVDDNNYDITSLNNQISLNKKIKVFIGVTNKTRDYQHFGSIIWFPLGIYILTGCSITHDVTSNSISIEAQDKMCLLNGDVGGQIQSPVELHRSMEWSDSENDYIFVEKLVYDIIYHVVTKLGGEDAGKVIISDIPLDYKAPLKYTGKTTKYFDANNNEIFDASNSNIVRTLRADDYAGYQLRDFTYPGELIAQPGESVSSILDSIKNALGNYEYFYDIEGNFIFQEIKNYMNTSFTPLTQLNNGNYIADFKKLPYVYSFKEKDVIQAVSNAPDWKNIKNDFIVWGVRNNSSEDGVPIMYHLAIDDKPFLPPTYRKPWQQFLVEYGESNPASPGMYYEELSAKLPQVYDKEFNEWGKDPVNYNYFFDMIDAKSELGKFSISNIGKRTLAFTDENVSLMYPPEIPDIIIIPQGTGMDYINHLNSIGQKFQTVLADEYEDLYTMTLGVGKDAFTVIREKLYQHTTFNEIVTIQCLPLYFLEVNNRIEIEDKRSNVHGDYIIKSMSIPLSFEGLMIVNAIRVSSRI